MSDYGYHYVNEEPADRVETDNERLTERHLFANGWGLEVTAFASHGFTHLQGGSHVLAPKIKGNKLVWSDDFPEDVPESEHVGAQGSTSWSSLHELGRIIEAVRSFPEYTHECDHSDCGY